ncbi:MAG: phosphatidylglycerophosphatase A [Endomicrobiales bacterium]
MKRNLTLEQKLRRRGIGITDLVDAAIAMYIYDPALGSEATMKKLLLREFRRALRDINVACLVEAGLYLEGAGHKGDIAGISRKKYDSDPIDLIADEILGQSIATYIAGTRALFEFERLDKTKPGILKTLPPMMDDVIAGLISGVMVKVCSR